MTKLRGVGVGVVFLVGCVVGGAVGRIGVPPASAQQAATLTHWEYFCVTRMNVDEFNKAGAQGWEMSAATTSDMTQWCFKRPKL